jgi:4-amino-4-deoxy-L-arabinose transferase-like glycosyltransferase
MGRYPSLWRSSSSNCAAPLPYNSRLFLQLIVINQQPKIETAGELRVSRFRTDWLLLAGFCAFLFFYGLSNFGLIGADEPRYAQIAREMLARHDWVTPVLGGEPWLEKPPLFYWQAMIAYSIFGVSDWAARLASAADGTLMVAVIYLFLRKFVRGVELDGALITASTAGVIGFSRAASTDMPLAAMFTMAMLAWYAWHKTNARRYLTAAYIFLGLAALAKGPVGPLLAAVVIGIFAAVKSDYRIWSRTLWLPGLLIFLVVTLPWYVAVEIKNPNFLHIFILEHNFARFGTNLYHHKQPFWYFVPVTLLGLVPWTVLACASLARSLRAWWGDRAGPEHDFSSFLLLWLLVPVIFFSASQSKLPGYILPAVPAGALLAAGYLHRRFSNEGGLSLVTAILHSIVAAAPVVPALMIQYLVLQHDLPWGKAAAISCALAAILAVALVFTLRSRIGLGGVRFTLVPVAFGVAAILRLGAPALDSTLSARPIATEIGRIEKGRLPMAAFHLSREVEYGLAFYRNQKIVQYGWEEIPAQAHLLVAPEGSQIDVAKQVPGRRVSYLGSYAPQGLDYYWVGPSAQR